MTKMQMLPAGIDYDEVVKTGDADAIAAVKAIAKNVKYNTYLYDFLESAYPWQRQVAAFTKDNTVIGTIAANRVGKSEIGCAIATCHLTGIYPSWWEGRRYNKPIQLMAACLNNDLNKTVLQRKLFGTPNYRLKKQIGTGMIPRELIHLASGVTGRGDDLTSIQIKHITGDYSEIYFRAYSQGAEAAQGVEADVLLIDEQPKDSFWAEAVTRLATTGGHAICSFTPLHGRTGLVEELMGLADYPDAPEDKFGAKWRQQGRWAMVRASWDDITHIDKEMQATLAKGYQSFEREARMFGIPMSGFGRVFPYQLKTALYDPHETKINSEWDHIVSIDIGHGIGRDPSAITQIVWDKDLDTFYVTDAKQDSTETTRDLTRLISSVNHTLPVVWPSDANRTSMSSPSSVAEQLREQGVNLLPKPFLNPKGADGKYNNYKAPGINYMNELFAEGKLKIADHCKDLIKQLEEYSYNSNGKLQDGRDDAIDSLRYGLMSIIQGYGSALDDANTFNNPAFDNDEDDWNTY